MIWYQMSALDIKLILLRLLLMLCWNSDNKILSLQSLYMDEVSKTPFLTVFWDAIENE